tara:strand:+ start:395 stop:1816 length:1422 start_codon:yes stop_codon:yes gene_type:complete
MAKVELPKVNEDQLKRSTLVMKSIDTTVISITKFLGRKEKFTAKQKKFLKAQQAMIKGQKRKDDEAESLKVEKKKEKKENRFVSAAKKKGGSLLDNLIAGVGSIFAGWLAGKIPEIIELIKKNMPRVKAIFDGITKTVGLIYEYFQSMFVIVYELGKSLFTLTPPDGEKIASEFSDIKGAWDSYLKSATNGFKALTGQDFQDPKDLEKVDKEVKDNSVDEDGKKVKKENKPVVDKKINKKEISQEELNEKMKDPKVIELANQLGDGKPKTKATNGYLNAVSVGKMLTDQGVGVWQHPDFNIKTGFTGSGLEGMMKRASNSFHSSGEALDIPIAGQGEERLNQIASMLGANKKKLGINELKWKDDADHMDHIHVSFKGDEPIKPASVAAAPSSKSTTVDNITAAKDIDSPTNDMQKKITQAVLSQQAQVPPMSVPESGNKAVVVDGGTTVSTPDIDSLLNTMQRTRVLTALAYQ